MVPRGQDWRWPRGHLFIQSPAKHLAPYLPLHLKNIVVWVARWRLLMRQLSIVTGVPKQPKVVIVVHKAINSGVIQQQAQIHLSAATQPCRFLA